MGFSYATCLGELVRTVSGEEFKQAMSGLAGAVAVVTTSGPDGHHATTVSALCSLSLDPPMVMLALANDSSLLSKARTSRRLGVNVLADHQTDTAIVCARRDDDKMSDVDWYFHQDLPRIPGCGVWLSCEIIQEFPGGDHTIITAEVLEVDIDSSASPCIYFKRTFRALSPVSGF